MIHNFKLPEFRVSQDAISGMEIPVWFKATMTTEEFLETAKGTAREGMGFEIACAQLCGCLLYTSPSPRDQRGSRMPSSA